MKHVANAAKCAAFLLILVLSLLKINEVLEPKYIYKNSDWATTSSYRQFYQMDKNSIDVLFLGSSVAVNAFIPQEIYNEYGIRSYNLGSEQQSPFLSYYWLKEALNYQSPKVVVFDTKFMKNIHPESPINTVEGMARKCLDPMRLSAVKAEAVSELCKLDKSQSLLSYYLTNIRFHSRWSELKEYDLNDQLVNKAELKGFSPVIGDGHDTYETFDAADTEVRTEYPSVMQEYLDRMTQLCREKGISLVLISLPGNEMSDGVNNTLTAYAAENGLQYYNLCSTEYYDQIGAELPRENVVGHQNIWGAIKTSRFMGKLLSENYGLERVTDQQYEDTREFYEQTKRSAVIPQIANVAAYLRELNSSKYAIFMVTHGDPMETLLSEGVEEAMTNLGLNCIWKENPSFAYAAVIIRGQVVEEASQEQISITGSFRRRRTVYSLKSAGAVGSSSVTIENEKLGKNADGLTIVVYDTNTCKVIDTVTFREGAAIRTTQG